MPAPTIDGAKPHSAAAALPGDFAVITWALTTADPTGTGVQYTDFSDRSIQFSGTWGGATAVLEGSNDNVTWLGLTDPQGNAISKTADGLEQVQEMTRYVRARLSAVGVGATVSASLFVKVNK